MTSSAQSPPQTGRDDETIETVLRSIRQILHDDTMNKDKKGQLMTSPTPQDELTLDPSMMVSAPLTSSSPEQKEAENTSADDLMGAQTIAAAEHSLKDLQTAFSVSGNKAIPSDTVISNGSGMTIEDMVRTEVRAMVRTWMDAHLPSLVEILVRAEIARLRPNS
ncbi:DUF2497 domain-containing protein [Gluconobacter sp. NFX36]|uniref:DUF2497 domain-containing protein n=1 Tax=Gluconobacter TaxID=441 RepID=UPI0003D341AC|nr:DUF2497 domain-containing protein [Gluconobacter japonicus]MBS1050925.1 DUF2497 domain-containing protein [Gluconobacter japonicus]GAD09406.1 hypothetical protein GFGA_1c1101 [Gluconobacter frateurii NBRC 103465]